MFSDQKCNNNDNNATTKTKITTTRAATRTTMASNVPSWWKTVESKEVHFSSPGAPKWKNIRIPHRFQAHRGINLRRVSTFSDFGLEIFQFLNFKNIFFSSMFHFIKFYLIELKHELIIRWVNYFNNNIYSFWMS